VIAASVRLIQHATKGVSGPTHVLETGEGIAVALAYIATAVIQGALYHAGASHAIVYGIIPAAAPLVIVGCTVVGIAGSRQDWSLIAVAIAVVGVGIAGLFVSAAASWAVAGTGVFVVALVAAVIKAWDQHHRLSVA
jgi:O-antigen/teichoic acid export membrane protein